jgi:hypothetical protein
MGTSDTYRSEQMPDIIRSIKTLGDELEQAINKKQQRDKVTCALLAVIEFLNSIPKFDHDCLAAPLVELLADLHDLDEGIIGRTLQTTKKAKGPKKGTWREYSEIRIVGIIEILSKDYKVPIDEACDFLARIIGNSDFIFKGQGNKPTQNTIKNLRYEIKKTMKGDAQLRESANSLRTELQIDRDTSLNAAKELIKHDLIAAKSLLKQNS